MKALLFAHVRAFEFEFAVPVSEISTKSTVLQRPALRNDPKSRPQLPLWLKPVLQADLRSQAPGASAEMDEGGSSAWYVVLGDCWCLFRSLLYARLSPVQPWCNSGRILLRFALAAVTRRII